MDTIKNVEGLEDAYRHVLQNNRFVEEKITLIKKLKVSVYYIATIIFCRVKTGSPSTVHIINGRAELRLQKYKNFTDVFYGLTQKNFSDLVRQLTHISFFRKSERIKVLIEAIRTYFKYESLNGPLIYWVDFVFWDLFLLKISPDIVLSDGHYDRLTTTLSELCKEHNIQFHMKQHGFVITDCQIPYKLHCDRVYVFDEKEEEYFRKNIVSNEDCEYIIEYNNNVKFTKYKKRGKLVAIIENRSVGMEDIIRSVIKVCEPEVEILIMLHPLSSAKYYRAVREERNVKFTRNKVWNADVIVSAPSALVYDYVRNGYNKNIYIVDKNNSLLDYKNKFDNVIYLCDIDELVGRLSNELETH